MTTRFDVERAVLASDLSTSARLVMFVLLAHADNDSARVMAKFTPSLSVLSQETGLDRSTVQRTLRRLDGDGWVIRQRPSVDQSRKGVRTRYRLAVPVDAHDTYPGADLGAPDTQARCTCHLGVGAPDHKPRCVVHPIDTIARSALDTQTPNGPSRNGSPQPQWLDGAIDLVAERLTAVTGRSYERRDLAESVRGFLRGKTVTSPAAFIRKCAEENPLQFEPTPGPPRYRRENH